MSKETEQHQGEPVAWMDPRSPQMHATISNEVKQHNIKFGGAPASAVNGYTIPLYTHADPGEVERLRETIRYFEAADKDSQKHVANMEALLEDLKGKTILSWSDKHRIDAALSASAELSALVERDERAAFEKWYLAEYYEGDAQCGLEWLSTEPCGGYRYSEPARHWKVWQARAALERKP